MEDTQTLEDIKPMRDVVKDYFIVAFHLCDGNKSEVSRRLKLSVRTVRQYCKDFDLNVDLPKKEIYNNEKEEVVYKGVTSDQRDKWYNRNCF
jgi:hypothetical protein